MIIYICLPIYSGSIHRSIKHTASILVCFKKKKAPALHLQSLYSFRKKLLKVEHWPFTAHLLPFPFRNKKESISQWKIKWRSLYLQAGEEGGWVWLYVSYSR